MPYNNTGRPKLLESLEDVGREACEEDWVWIRASDDDTERPYSCAAEIRRNCRSNDAGESRIPAAASS